MRVARASRDNHLARENRANPRSGKIADARNAILSRKRVTAREIKSGTALS